MTMQSCLDLEPKTQLADTNYWKSPEHFKLFATQFYSWSADFRWLDDSQHADIRSDLFAGSTVNIYSNGTNSIPSSDKHYTDNYNRIRQTNTLLQQADAYEQQADIAISVGEARFFRAYCYFNLVRAFGEVPLVTFKVMGSDYDAAVLAAGHCGFGMGATPTAIAPSASHTWRSKRWTKPAKLNSRGIATLITPASLPSS